MERIPEQLRSREVEELRVSVKDFLTPRLLTLRLAWLAVQYNQFRVFEHHLAVGLHGVREPNVTPDDAVMSNSCMAPQDGGVGVNGNMILEVRVPLILLPSTKLTLFILSKRIECSQGHTVVKSHPSADGGGFADHHARPMIDEERLANRSAGIDIDAGVAVRHLGHHTGEERHSHQVEPVRQALHGNGLHARVAEQNLLMA